MTRRCEITGCDKVARFGVRCKNHTPDWPGRYPDKQARIKETTRPKVKKIQ